LRVLSQGWATASLSELFDFKYGKGLTQEKRNGQGQIEVYGSNGVVGHHDVAVTQGPTIVVGRKGSVGEVHLSKQPCWPIDTAYFVDEFPCGLPPQYWALLLKSLCLGQQEKSSAIPGINRDDIYKNVVPLPPLTEQYRIVAKLEELLAKVEVSQKRLKNITVTLKRFRQAVLAAACTGRLTVDWREKNGLDEGEDLPEGWRCCSIADVGKVCNGSTPSRKCSEYWNGSIHWVSSGEVRNNIITATRENITQDGYKNSSVRLLPPGTVLLAMIGEGKTRGQTAILRIGATINQNIAAVVIDSKLISSEYLWYWFQFQYEITRQSGSGTGPQALNCQRVRELPLNLPTLQEQYEIVRRVEGFFAVSNQLEVPYQKAKIYVDKLTQSILAKAFRGELVPQDPNDEPASALLERIRAERVKAAPTPSRAGTPRPARKASAPKSAPKPKSDPIPLAAKSVVVTGGLIPDRILTVMQPGRDYTRAEITAASGISDTEWTWAIRQLKEKGKVKQSGERRGAKYSRR
jgi:type I restriction enzyme, S subunit